MKKKTENQDWASQPVRLEKITWDNFEAITNLHVNEEQRNFVARNKDSLVHAFLAITDENKQVFTFGIYKGKKPIGFLMIGYDIGEDDGMEPSADWFLRNSYYIWRFMIDKRYQGNGYGREALKLALDFVLTFPAGGLQRTLASGGGYRGPRERTCGGQGLLRPWLGSHAPSLCVGEDKECKLDPHPRESKHGGPLGPGVECRPGTPTLCQAVSKLSDAECCSAVSDS